MTDPPPVHGSQTGLWITVVVVLFVVTFATAWLVRP